MIRSLLASALRQKVAGADAEEAGRQIWDTPGPRWFRPEDAIWRVHQSSTMFPGGVAALLLQSLHPGAMAGVAGHSGYRADPWGRLQRTSHYLAVTTYGTAADAQQTVDRIRAIHARVRGRDHLGRPYRADDPHLLRWVQIAETWSFLAAHQRYARRRLSPEDADAYVAQTSSVGARLGAVDLPTTLLGLTEQMTRYRAELMPSPAAREAAQFLIWSPPLPLAVRPGYLSIVAGGLTLLPTWARAMLNLTVPRVATPAVLGAGWVGARTVEWALSPQAPDRTGGYEQTSRPAD